MPASPTRRAFTLLELLIVIAILAVLIAVLLPAVSRARKAGQMAVSMSNLRQINLAGAMYKDANRGQLPFTAVYRRGSASSDRADPGKGLIGLCSWSFGGKCNDAWWAQGPASRRGFDVEARDRPLNPYLYPDLDWLCPERSTSDGPELSADDNARAIHAKVFRDPSDSVTHQRAWPRPSPEVSGYQDVGTSYHLNYKWYPPLEQQMPGSSDRRFLARIAFGNQRIVLADAFQPARLVWLNDQYADVIAHQPDPGFRMINGYGDANKSLMAFLDGHAAYHPVTPGAGASSFSSDRYTFIFDGLRVPGK